MATLCQFDGRSGPRASHKAGRTHSRLWWSEDVPKMSEADFARTSRVPRAIFNTLAAAAALFSFFSGALDLEVEAKLIRRAFGARPYQFW